MKKVLFFIENLGSGGAERQLTGLSVMLKEIGYDVKVCYYVKKEFYLPFLQENGVEGVFLQEASNKYRRYFAIKQYIKRYNPNTIISFSRSPSIITCLIKLLGGKFKLITSERSTTQHIGVMEKILFYLYRWTDIIVPNSNSQAEFIRRNFPNLSNKIKVITNFVDTDKFSPSNKTQSNHDITKIICVGRVGYRFPEKNIIRFIDVITKVVNDGYKINVDWYGVNLEDDYSQVILKKIKHNNLEKIFILHNPSSYIQEEYLKADVFCLPSLYEGFPNVLCEAMSCGKPVLCSRVCDNPTIVSEGENGLMFNPLDVDDMAEVIEKYINLSEEKKKDMAIISRKIAVYMFSKKSFIDKYIDIL